MIIEVIEELTFKNPKPIKYSVDIKLENHYVVSLSIISNELILNSLKYAFKEIANPKIEIKVTQLNNVISYEYRDNGPGLDWRIRGTGEGQSIITDFVKQVYGKVVDEQTSGYLFKFEFQKRYPLFEKVEILHFKDEMPIKDN